jgi:hypothetical protein
VYVCVRACVCSDGSNDDDDNGDDSYLGDDGDYGDRDGKDSAWTSSMRYIFVCKCVCV